MANELNSSDRELEPPKLEERIAKIFAKIAGFIQLPAFKKHLTFRPDSDLADLEMVKLKARVIIEFQEVLKLYDLSPENLDSSGVDIDSRIVKLALACDWPIIELKKVFMEAQAGLLAQATTRPMNSIEEDILLQAMDTDNSENPERVGRQLPEALGKLIRLQRIRPSTELFGTLKTLAGRVKYPWVRVVDALFQSFNRELARQNTKAKTSDVDGAVERTRRSIPAGLADPTSRKS